MLASSLAIAVCLLGADPSQLDAPFTGIMVVDLDFARTLLDPSVNRIPASAKGVMAIEVADYSPAHKKLNELSIIQSVNGKKVKTVSEYDEQLKGMKIGDEIKLEGYGRRQLPGSDRYVWSAKGSAKIVPVSKRDFLDNSADLVFDEFTKQTWRTHKSDPGRYQDSIDLYFQEVGGEADNLILRVSYRADEWIFMEKVSLKIGDRVSVITEDTVRFETEVVTDGRGVAEWVHIPVKKDLYKTLRDMGSAFSGRIRRQGRTKLSDRDITYQELSRLRTMLDLYEAKGGTP